MFPIKYIDNNLVWNKDNEVFAYYEPVSYTHLDVYKRQSLAGVAVATPADNSPSVSNRGAQITRKHTQKLPILG